MFAHADRYSRGMEIVDVSAQITALQQGLLIAPHHLATLARQVKHQFDTARANRIAEWKHQGRDVPFCALNIFVRARGKAALEISWRRAVVRLPGIKRTRTIWKHCVASEVALHATELDYDLVAQAVAELNQLRRTRNIFAHLSKVLRAAQVKLAACQHHPEPEDEFPAMQADLPLSVSPARTGTTPIPRPISKKPALRDRS